MFGKNDKMGDLSTLNHSNLTPKEVKKNVIKDPSPHVKQLANTLSLKDANSVDQFGFDLQNQLDASAKDVVNALNSRDTGKIGADLNQLLVTIKDSQSLGNPRHKGLLSKFMRRGKHYLYQAQANYQTTGANIDTISHSLTKSVDKLHADNQMLDELYNNNRKYYYDVQDYIDAGTLKLYELDSKTLPDLEAKLKDDSVTTIDAQDVQRVRAFRDRLSKRVYNLKLAQQVALQQGPQIMMIQASNRELADNINESITNAVPLWRNQVAMQISLMKQEQAVKVQSAVHDLTNRLLTENAKQMHDSSIQIAHQSQTGIVDESTIEASWSSLVDQIKSIQEIQISGDQKRNEATKRLSNLQSKYESQIRSITGQRRTIHAEEYDVDPKALEDHDDQSDDVIDGSATDRDVND